MKRLRTLIILAIFLSGLSNITQASAYTISQNIGTSQHAGATAGQTFTMPAAGVLTGISVTNLAFRAPSCTGVAEMKLYSTPSKTNLLATSTNRLNDSDSSLGGQIICDFNGVSGTFNFSSIVLSAGSYYFEIYIFRWKWYFLRE